MSVPVRIHKDRFESWIHACPGRIDEVVDLYRKEGPRIVIPILRSLIPLGKTGFMRESVTSRETPFGFSVYLTAEYAVFVDQGTRPHTIFAGPTKKALRWYGPYGEPIFAVWVDHPGIKGRHFMHWTSRLSIEPLINLLRDIWRRVFGS